MTVETSISMVNGYHKETPVSDMAITSHLPYRFAIIVYGPISLSGSILFDDVIFYKIIDKILIVLKPDRVIIMVDDQIEVSSLAELKSYMESLPAEDRMPPKMIRFLVGGETVAIEETEFWALCGGPSPYHDSWTFSFYTKERLNQAFEVACERACGVAQGSIKPIEASPTPVQKPLWKRLLCH